MAHEDPLTAARLAHGEALDRFVRSAVIIAEWSKTLPDEHRETFVKLCRTLPTTICFCGCHISYVGD